MAEDQEQEQEREKPLQAGTGQTKSDEELKNEQQ